MPSKHAKAAKPKVINDSQIHSKDTGSCEVQIAIMTDEIKRLTAHLQINAKDHATRRSLLRKVGSRKRLLNYLLGEDRTRYLKTCKKNGIKPSAIITINPNPRSALSPEKASSELPKGE
jgi:small subunit ribosomal protein S15